ncbi:MAG: anaerobic ribonucleoside-triphosphate reductase activating protein [Bacteroidales bacterium]|nr:anaerobic ribonucleoside-triphosphate reductase activating protein [Bacteroidales bacterium]
MLKYFNYDIVFQEIPDEVTLAVNFSLCPNRCQGCHSPWLWQDKGDEFTVQALDNLIKTYNGDFTCFAFMGGDNDPVAVNKMAAYIKDNYKNIKTAWYSGKEEIDKAIDLKNFDYIKIGPYKKEFGDLKQKTTNQRLYKILPDGEKEDITYKFQKK